MSDLPNKKRNSFDRIPNLTSISIYPYIESHKFHKFVHFCFNPTSVDSKSIPLAIRLKAPGAVGEG